MAVDDFLLFLFKKKILRWVDGWWCGGGVVGWVLVTDLHSP
jgi:hypothetical protein